MGFSDGWTSKCRQLVSVLDRRSIHALRALAESRTARVMVLGGVAVALSGAATWSLRPLPDDGEGLSNFCRSMAGGDVVRARACYGRLVPVLEELKESRKDGYDVQQIGEACSGVANRSGWDVCTVTVEVEGLFLTRWTTLEFAKAKIEPLVVTEPDKGRF